MEIVEDLKLILDLILRHKLLALSMVLSWSSMGLLSELLFMFFWMILRDVYPVLPKKTPGQILYALILAALGGPIVMMINLYYIHDIRKSVRKDSDDNGGNFIRVVPDTPIIPMRK